MKANFKFFTKVTLFILSAVNLLSMVFSQNVTFLLTEEKCALKGDKTNGKKPVIYSMLMTNYLELYRLHGSNIPQVSVQIRAPSYKSYKNHSMNLFGLRQVQEQQIRNPESQFTGE